MSKEKQVTCVTLATEIAELRVMRTDANASDNLIFARFAAYAVLDNIPRKDAFKTLESKIGMETDSQMEWVKFAKRRVGMGYRVIKGTSVKPAHPKKDEIIRVWKAGKVSKGNGLETRYQEMLGGTKNVATIDQKLADVLKEFKTQNKVAEARAIITEVLGEVEVEVFETQEQYS